MSVVSNLTASPARGTIEHMLVSALRKLKPVLNYADRNKDIRLSIVNQFGTFQPVYVNRRNWTILNPVYADTVLSVFDSDKLLPVMMFDLETNQAQLLSLILNHGLDSYLTPIPDVDAVMSLVTRLLNTDFTMLRFLADSDYIGDAIDIYFDEVEPVSIKIENKDGLGPESNTPTISQGNNYDVPTLNPDFQILKPILFDAWRRGQDSLGVHFYMDDYKFEALFTAPEKMTHANAIETNISMNTSKPQALVIHDIWRKRWLSSQWQARHINIAVDLNVPREYADLNLCGVPDGWRSYANRAYVADLNHLDYMYDLVCSRAGSDNIIYMVYSSSKVASDYVKARGWILIEDSFKHGT